VRSRKLKWGDPEGLRRALDLGWTVAAAKEPGPGALQDAHAIVDAATPDTADFDSLYLSPALDAATATLNVLDFIRNREPGLVAQTASLCRDTVDMYVQEKEGMDSQDPDLEAQILRHPLMQRELERQRLDLQRAAALASGQETLERLRGEWRQPKKSNLDLA
jgi:uncharacterized protein